MKAWVARFELVGYIEKWAGKPQWNCHDQSMLHDCVPVQRSAYRFYKRLAAGGVADVLYAAVLTSTAHGTGTRRQSRRTRRNYPPPAKKISPRHPRRWTSSPSRAMKRSASGSRASSMPPAGSPTRKSGSRKESSSSTAGRSPMNSRNGPAIWRATPRMSSPWPTGWRCSSRRCGISVRRGAGCWCSGATSSARFPFSFSGCSSWRCRSGPACWRPEERGRSFADGFERISCAM